MTRTLFIHIDAPTNKMELGYMRSGLEVNAAGEFSEQCCEEHSSWKIAFDAGEKCLLLRAISHNGSISFFAVSDPMNATISALWVIDQTLLENRLY